MQVTKLNPFRVFHCGQDNWVKISHVMSINVEKGDEVEIRTEQMINLVTCESWGLRIEFKFFHETLVEIWGSSWDKSHVISISAKEFHSFKEYAVAEKLTYFGKITINKSSDIFEKPRPNFRLLNDQQVTFIFNDKKEYDFVPKTWGAYITPSIFGRLKSFGIKAMINTKEDCIYLVDDDFNDEFLEFLNSESIEVFSFCGFKN